VNYPVPKNCDDPIIVNFFPPPDSEHRIICNFSPIEIDGHIGTSTEATSYIWASNNHIEAKEYHFTQKLSTDKGYFYKGTKVFSITGEERVGYFGTAEKMENPIAKNCWFFSEIILTAVAILFIIYSIKKPHTEGEMYWWQELIFIFCIATLGGFYFILAIIFLSR